MVERSDHDEQSTLVNREPQRAVARGPSLVDGFSARIEGRYCFGLFAASLIVRS